jgi:hypothetical protein
MESGVKFVFDTLCRVREILEDFVSYDLSEEIVFVSGGFLRRLVVAGGGEAEKPLPKKIRMTVKTRRFPRSVSSPDGVETNYHDRILTVKYPPHVNAPQYRLYFERRTLLRRHEPLEPDELFSVRITRDVQNRIWYSFHFDHDELIDLPPLSVRVSRFHMKETSEPFPELLLGRACCREHAALPVDRSISLELCPEGCTCSKVDTVHGGELYEEEICYSIEVLDCEGKERLKERLDLAGMEMRRLVMLEKLHGALNSARQEYDVRCHVSTGFAVLVDDFHLPSVRRYVSSMLWKDYAKMTFFSLMPGL